MLVAAGEAAAYFFLYSPGEIFFSFFFYFFFYCSEIFSILNFMRNSEKLKENQKNPEKRG